MTKIIEKVVSFIIGMSIIWVPMLGVVICNTIFKLLGI